MEAKLSSNPFSLTFGREPLSFINREQLTDEVKRKFLPDNPESQAVKTTSHKLRKTTMKDNQN